MGPIGHSTISAGIGASIWGITDSFAAGATALGVGVLTDVDHLVDYYQWYVLRKTNRIILLFHAWEYGAIAALALLFFYHPVFLAATVAHLGHIATDHFHNRMAPWSYSVTYRVIVRFDKDRIAPYHDVLRSYETWLHMLPFGNRLEPWYRRNIEPWFRSRIGS